LNLYLLVAQLICQFSWGVYCFLHSPHNIMLSLLNVALIVITVASHLAPDSEELLFQRAYLAAWVVPAFILALSSLTGIFEMENLALAKAGVPPITPPIEGTSAAYSTAFRNYLISQLILPTFRIINWPLSLFGK
jgi:hypothetical protein